MEIGLVGVGKMGAGLMRRWLAAGHSVTVYDVNHEAQDVVVQAGGVFVESLEKLVQTLTVPRNIWLMVPAGDPVKEAVKRLSQQLDSGDTVIDGGNSFYKDSAVHAEKLAKRGIHFIDVGVSGGVAGERTGYALMAGGEAAHIAAVQELFNALMADQAFAHVGPVSSGHFVKMVHNAVEYGMMQAIGEGFDLLKHGPYKDVNVAQVAKLWSHGTIVRSYLMELAAAALAEDKDLDGIAAYVDDSGEGRWSVQAAVEHAVPFWVNTAALYARFDSRQQDSYAAKLVASLRKRFGGHEVKKAD